MRAPLIVVLSTVVLGACGRSRVEPATPERSPAVHRLVEAAVTDTFFGAIAHFDYAALRRSVTPDFELVEDTLRLTTEGFVDFIRPLEGRGTIAYRFENLNTRVVGNTAWTTYRNFGTLRLDGQGRTKEWLETAVLVRLDGVWRIDRLHSTLVRPR